MIMKKIICVFCVISGFLMAISCASLMATPFDEYPYASDGDAYIVPGGRLVHRSLKCPNIQSTSGYKKVSSADQYKYGFGTCYDCWLMSK